MQVKSTNKPDDKIMLTINLLAEDIAQVKSGVVNKLGANVKVAGFRPGNAPAEIIEKNIDQNQLQTEVLEELINQTYPQAVRSEQIRPVDRPKITIKKFVPFTELEYEAETTVLGEIKLPDYTKIRKERPKASVTAADVNGVLDSLRKRMAEKKDVKRAAKSGDEVIIDFKGFDGKSQPIKGADGKDYPLLLGSDTFIPGFEDNIVGLKPGQEKKFKLKFPKDYGMKNLAGHEVTFEITVKKVQELSLPELDDAFAAKVGPAKDIKSLKEDIKKQLGIEQQQRSNQDYEVELIREIADKTKVKVPDVLVEDQINRMITELKQNLVYRGMTYQEFLESEGMSEEDYKTKRLMPEAMSRVKASLVLAEVAEREQINVTPEELEIRLQLLKGQYKDTATLAELEKPEARQDIASRLLSEKTRAKLVDYATKK